MMGEAEIKEKFMKDELTKQEATIELRHSIDCVYIRQNLVDRWEMEKDEQKELVTK